MLTAVMQEAARTVNHEQDGTIALGSPLLLHVLSRQPLLMLTRP